MPNWSHSLCYNEFTVFYLLQTNQLPPFALIAIDLIIHLIQSGRERIGTYRFF